MNAQPQIAWYHPIAGGYASSAMPGFSDVVFGVGKKFDELFHGAFVFEDSASNLALPPAFESGPCSAYKDMESASFPGSCTIEDGSRSLVVAFPKTREEVAFICGRSPLGALPLGVQNECIAAMFGASFWYVLHAGLGERELVHLLYPTAVENIAAQADRQAMVRENVEAIQASSRTLTSFVHEHIRPRL